MNPRIASIFLAMVNNVAKNMDLFKTLLSVLRGKYPEVELLAHMVTLFLIFRGTAIPFSIATVGIVLDLAFFPSVIHLGKFPRSVCRDSLFFFLTVLKYNLDTEKGHKS